MKRDASPDHGDRGSPDRASPAYTSRHPFYVLFTDLDGTLLDHTTYEWKEARPALSLCGKLGVPVILISSKTRAEMDPLRRELGLSDPFVSENGGGVFFPREATLPPPPGVIPKEGLWALPLGARYETLVRALREIRGETAWSIRGFSDMSVEEISRLTGLDLHASERAAQREFDEPFLLPESEGSRFEVLQESAQKKGLQVTRGGRFHHLHGKSDKAGAMERLISWYKGFHHPVETIALGDSPNDFTMLMRADHPVLVRSARAYPELGVTIPHLITTRKRGPGGWNEAVLEILGPSSKGGSLRDV